MNQKEADIIKDAIQVPARYDDGNNSPPTFYYRINERSMRHLLALIDGMVDVSEKVETPERPRLSFPRCSSFCILCNEWFGPEPTGLTGKGAKRSG